MIKTEQALKRLERSMSLQQETHAEWLEISTNKNKQKETGISEQFATAFEQEARAELEVLMIAVEAVREKLEKEENKALTLEQLKSLTGKKVYRQPKLAPPQEVKINEIFQNNMVEIQLNCGRGALIDFNDYNFYEHKPVEVEHVTK